MTKSEQIGKLAEALASAQGHIRNATKDSENPAFKRDGKASKYADLTAIWDACRDHLSLAGIAVVQSPRTEGATVYVETMLIHSSGEWIAGEMGATAAGPSAQMVGSATTYLRRYSLASMVGVAPEGEDDDGNAAGSPKSIKRWTLPAPKASSPQPVPPLQPEAVAILSATGNPGEEPPPAAVGEPSLTQFAFMVSAAEDFTALNKMGKEVKKLLPSDRARGQLMITERAEHLRAAAPPPGSKP